MLVVAALAVATANGASAYSWSPPYASVHLHGLITFTPNEGGSPFTCTVTLDFKTKKSRIYAVKFPKGNCGVGFNDLPWGVGISNANSGYIESNGYDGKGTCVQRQATYEVNKSGVWKLPPGQCFSGTLRSNPPVTIVP
jgi:hypothetical protein